MLMYNTSTKGMAANFRKAINIADKIKKINLILFCAHSMEPNFREKILISLVSRKHMTTVIETSNSVELPNAG